MTNTKNLLDQVLKATLNDTTVEDFEVLNQAYLDSRTESYKVASKQRFDEIVAAMQQDAVRFHQI